MIEFDHPAALNWLWLVAAVVVLGLFGLRQRHRALQLFADRGLLPRLAPSVGWARPLVRLGLVVAALALLVVALLGPRWGEGTITVLRRNIDLMVVLDVSRSMLARDIAPNRLERAKLSIRDDLLPSLGGDRIGLIAFAGAAALKCPLTNDYGFFRLALAEISVNSVARGGTLIGDAIREARRHFDPARPSHKVILLITDGEDHDSFPVEAAAAAWKEDDIPIVAVGLGDDREGARVPVNGQADQFVEYQGAPVWSRADFEQLRQIAAVSDLNAFVPVGTRNFDLGEIYRRRIVPALNAREELEQTHVRRPARYHPFAAAALVLLLIEAFFRDNTRRLPQGAPPPRAREG